MSLQKLVIGCGYLGLRVAEIWRDAGATVHAVTRSADRAEKWSRIGLHPVLADIMKPDSLRQLPPVATVLMAVGFDRASGHSIRTLYVAGLKHTLEALPPSVNRILYVSSTGVYGQSADEWVDEQSPCRPAREGGRACWEAEQTLQGHALGNRSVVLRMAGIYGPGRIPRRAELQAGRTIDAPAEGYLNLIHVDDAASVVVAAEQFPAVPSLFCVCDDQPVIRREYYRELARLVGAPEPRFEARPSPSSASQRAGSSKRVSNRRMKEQLKVALKYPTCREGLEAIVRAELQP